MYVHVYVCIAPYYDLLIYVLKRVGMLFRVHLGLRAHLIKGKSSAAADPGQMAPEEGPPPVELARLGLGFGVWCL